MLVVRKTGYEALAIRLSNRDGLLFVTDEAFSFFLMMEKVISSLRKEVKKKIIEDLDVIEKWNVVSEDMEDGIQTILVEKVVYGTIAINRKRRPISRKLKAFERRCNLPDIQVVASYSYRHQLAAE